MGPGNESKNWVQEKISFTDSSSTDAISQGNAQMYGPIGPMMKGLKSFGLMGSRIRMTRELVFKDQRDFAMLFNFQISIESVCMKTKTNRINTVLKTE